MTSGFQGARAELERVITIHADPDTVFPLLCPVREGEWLDGWIGKPIYAASGRAEENGVFVTEHAGQADTIWFVAKHDIATHQIEFVYFIPGQQVVRLFVAVTPGIGDASHIHARYIRTGISEAGNDLVRNADARFGTMMREWEDSLNHYLRTGTRLRLTG